jgi:hypothetical protein
VLRLSINQKQGGLIMTRNYRIIKIPTFPIGSFHYEVSVKTCSAVFIWVHLKNFPTIKEAEDFIKTNPTSANRD